MEFPKTNHFEEDLVHSKIMGPNTLKLTEELLEGDPIPPGRSCSTWAAGPA